MPDKCCNILSVVLSIAKISLALPSKIKIYMNKRTDNVSEVAKALSAESNVNPTDLPGFIGIYSNVVNFLLVHPAKVIIFAILLLITIIFSYGKFGNGVEFFPQVEPELSKLVIYGRGNLSVDEKNFKVRE